MKIGYVYKLCCNDVNISEIYVGSTANMKERKKQHRKACNNPNPNRGIANLKVYKYIRDNGGFDNWSIVMVETVEYDDKKQLHARERFHLEDLKATLNAQIPTRPRAEWVEENKEQISQYKREYYKSNKDDINQKNKEYREANKEHYKEINKDYYEANKEHLAHKHKVYHEANKDAINQKCKEYREAHADTIKARRSVKHNCECGGQYTHCNKSQHIKTKRHIDSLATIASK